MLSKRETFAPLLLVLASAGIFLLAFGIRTTWLPDVVPVADSEALQSMWGLEAAVEVTDRKPYHVSVGIARVGRDVKAELLAHG